MEEKFYEINHGRANKYLWLKVKGEIKKGPPFTRDLVKQNKIIFERYSGTMEADILGAVEPFYSENLVKLLKDNGVKLRTYPIKVVFDKPLPKYYMIEPVSYCGQKLWERHKISNEMLEAWLKDGQKIYYLHSNKLDNSRSYCFNLSNWDGSYLFGIKDTFFIIITEKLKRIIEKAKLKSVVFQEIRPIVEVIKND